MTLRPEKVKKAALSALALMFVSQPVLAQEFVRPGEEATFRVEERRAPMPEGQELPRFRGYRVTLFSSPCDSCEMGKRMFLDAHDNVWYLLTREDRIVRVASDNRSFTEYKLPSGSGPYSAAIDKQGKVWISAHGIEMLLELDPETRMISTHAPKSHGFLVHVNYNPVDGKVYFVQPGANLIVSFDRKEGFREYPIPTPQSGPARLDFDSKGMVWFPELYQNKLARLNPKTGKFTEWPLPTAKGFPSYVRVDQHDVVWISQPMKDRIVRFDKRYQFKEYVVPTKDSIVSTTDQDASGLIWFTEGGWRGSAGGNKIGTLDPLSGRFDEMGVPIRNSQPAGIVVTRSGDIWFQLSAKGKVIRLRKESK